MPRPSAIIQPLLTPPASSEDLVQWVLSYIRQEDLFAPGDGVLVAVSGGPDSVALLHLLLRLRAALDLNLAVGHFDHGLRRESREDAAFVAALAGSLGLPCHRGREDVAALARAEKISLQMAGRKLRLKFLKETCRVQGYGKLALGHTADDQVELFWLRLLRGAGPEGLQGMRPATPFGLVRPLLAVGKAPLLAWLAQESLPYRQDVSNQSRRYLRNRIRLDLLPQLRRYNPRLTEAIWRAQALLQEDEGFLAQETERLWGLVGRAVGRDFFSLSLPRFFRLEPIFQKRLLRAGAGKLMEDQALTASQVASLMELAGGEKSGGVISLGEVRVARAASEVHFFRRLPEPPRGAGVLLTASAGAAESEGWCWQITSRPYRQEEGRPSAPQTAWLDRDRVALPLEVRFFRPGDRFWPQGAPGPKKLQDFLVDSKVPRWLRPYLPLVVDGGQIVWVPGLRVADPVTLNPATRTILELHLSPATPATRWIWEVFLACCLGEAG